MATTSPDNLRTPNPTDPYNLVADLAILGSDVQTALNRRANAYRGTASQRTAFTSAEDGVIWQDTDGIGMIWKRSSTSWVPAVWRWAGTTAQMNAFAAPDGFVWYSTSDNFEYVRLGGAWGRASGVLAQGENDSGSTTLNSTSGFTVVASPGGLSVPVTVAHQTDVKITMVANFAGNASAVCQSAVSLAGATTHVPDIDSPGLGKVLASNQNAVSTQLLTLNAGTTNVVARARASTTVVFSKAFILVEKL